MSQKEIKDMEKLAESLKKCEIEESEPPAVVFSDTCDEMLLLQFPKPKYKAPPVFLHKPVKFTPHMRKILNRGVQFYRPVVGHHYTKICCQSFEDHKALVQYFDNKHLPYHTFGHPNKRKMKIVIRGLPQDVDLNVLKKALLSASIPVVRVHIMKRNEYANHLPILVLAVVPNNDEGRKILQVQMLFGHNIKIEPPKPRIMQCHRCQKWGHVQRYCHGHVQCVKCGSNHMSKRCTRDPDKEPPKCANCGGDHTSNYRLCPYSPSSPEYINKMSLNNVNKTMFPGMFALKKKLVTIQNCHQYMRGRV